MKRSLTVLVLSIALFACQKEISWENFDNKGTAVFTLQTSATTCINANISGIYTKGVALTSSNKASVSVNVATAGTYNVSTGTVNGVTFTGSGTFNATGVQTITLQGSGTPTTDGTFSLPISAGNTTCTLSVTVLASGASAATGSLGGAPNACTSASVNGSYTAGTALSSSNTVQIQVNVATTGAFSISTNSVNGLSFSQSGTFSTTGVQNVILQGSGTPTASGTSTYSVSFGSSTCSFPVTINASSGGTSTGTTTPGPYYWQFTEGSNTYQGTVDESDAVMTVTSAAGITFSSLHIFGFSPTRDSVFQLTIVDMNGNIQTNETYNSSSQTNNSGGIAFDSPYEHYGATTVTAGVNILVKVTSHDPNAKIIQGTFSGTVLNDTDPGVKTITNGQFKFKYH